jgi:hypothetical protein
MTWNLSCGFSKQDATTRRDATGLGLLSCDVMRATDLARRIGGSIYLADLFGMSLFYKTTAIYTYDERWPQPPATHKHGFVSGRVFYFNLPKFVRTVHIVVHLHFVLLCKERFDGVRMNAQQAILHKTLDGPL